MDASLIAQYVIGLTTLNTNQQISADVSGNGIITSFDAGLIAQYVIGLPNPGSSGAWRFTPANRAYAATEADQNNQDYTAVLLGDVTGNWTTPTGAGFSEPVFAPGDTVSVSLPAMNAAPNQPVIIPITVGDLTGRNVLSYQFDLIYDAGIIQPQTNPTEIVGTLSDELSVAVNVPADYDGDGKADVAVFRNGSWYLNRSASGFAGITFGAAADKPIPNVFVR